jgi:ribosomal protein S18 acetylase RimI-like enzyme
MDRAKTLDALTAVDIPRVGEFARRVWREHYASLLSAGQIEYMLRERYDEKDLQRYLDAPDRWFELLRLEGALAGFLRCLRSSDEELKIEEIYLESSQRGKGLGRWMLESAESRARALGCRRLSLYVNKRNEVAIRAYRRGGFAVREEVVVEIGGGFVMDDYLLWKVLTEGS